MCTGQGGVRGPSPQQVKSTVKFRQPPQRTLVVEGVRVLEVKASHPLLENPANKRNDGEHAAYLNHFLDDDHHDGSRDVLSMIVMRKPYRYRHRHAHDAHDRLGAWERKRDKAHRRSTVLMLSRTSSATHRVHHPPRL
jgi:hypothetical protein